MNTKKIFSVFLAKDLCKLGHRIVDIKYSKEQDKQIYVFECNAKFNTDFANIKKEFEKQKGLKKVSKVSNSYI